jgi:proton glutamate symport protein
MFTLFKRLGFTAWIFIGMGVGALLGWLTPGFAEELKPFSNAFIRMIKSVIVPILFATLVVGIASHGDDLRKVGRLAWRSMVYFWSMTALALVIGLAAPHLTHPGRGVMIPPPDAAAEASIPEPAPTNLTTFVDHLIPNSIFDAGSKNGVLQVVFWSILFGIALALVKSEQRGPMLKWVESLMEVMFKFVGLVMKFAPIGIGAALAVTVSHSGVEVLKNLALLVATLYGALIVFALIAFLPVMYFLKIPIKAFVRAVKDPAIIAFSTTSSDAALPTAIENMTKFGVPRPIVSFVMPTGYSFNLDGSTLYLGVASIFVAQAAGVHLSFGQIMAMMGTLLLTSKGIAAVPRASLVVLAGTLHVYGLPVEGIAVILGVDELMDMARTMTNLVGNCLATAVMGRWEKEYIPGTDFDPATKHA